MKLARAVFPSECSSIVYFLIVYKQQYYSDFYSIHECIHFTFGIIHS